MAAPEIEEAYRISRELGLTPPSMEQPEYNMFARDKMEHEYLQLFEQEQLGTTIWSPLASGLLTGKYMDGTPDGSRTSLENYKFIRDQFESADYIERHEKVQELYQLAEELGLPLVNLALCWCLKNQNVSTVILGASKIEQLKQNLQSLNHMSILDDSVMDRIDGILKNKP